MQRASNILQLQSTHYTNNRHNRNKYQNPLSSYPVHFQASIVNEKLNVPKA
jgi:hypothetical protein